MRKHGMPARALCCLAALLLALAALPARAESAEKTGFSAKGVIEGPRPVTLYAPISGRVEDFAWQAGDRAAQDDLALSLLPQLVYAPADGVVSSLRARPGDLCGSVALQYGALCYISRDRLWHIDGQISSSQEDAETRAIAVGQTVKLQHGTVDNKVRGVGTIIGVDQTRFTVELETGGFELDDDVRIYLEDSKDYGRDDQIGSGKIRRPAQLPVSGEGMVADVLVQEGERVSRGQPLFMLDDASARYAQDARVSPELRFPLSGVIAEVQVRGGMYVQQGQALMSLMPEGGLEAALEVDELDIARVRVGDSVRVTVDAYSGERTGTVKEIQPLGRVVLDTTKFIVKLSFEKTDDLMVGMHVRAYWD